MANWARRQSVRVSNFEIRAAQLLTRRVDKNIRRRPKFVDCQIFNVCFVVIGEARALTAALSNNEK